MGARKGAKPKPSARDARKAVALARSGRRRGSVLWIAATVIVAGALLALVIITVTTNARTHMPETQAAGLNNPPATVAVGENTLPPWPAPTDASAAVRAAGLPMMGSEGSVEHIHAHLDVIVDGQKVPIPANIGVDLKRRAMSPLHIHDDSGVVHIESPVRRQFSLGELFSEWQVSLSPDNIGGLRAADGKVVRVFVNGIPQTGNPAAITFAAHDEVAVVYGVPRPGETVPAKYDFPQGD